MQSPKRWRITVGAAYRWPFGEMAGQFRFPPPKPARSARGRSPTASNLMTQNLESYASDGELQFTLPDVPRRRGVPPISQRGNVNEIIGKFGGADQLRNAVNYELLPL